MKLIVHLVFHLRLKYLAVIHLSWKVTFVDEILGFHKQNWTNTNPKPLGNCKTKTALVSEKSEHSIAITENIGGTPHMEFVC